MGLLNTDNYEIVAIVDKLSQGDRRQRVGKNYLMQDSELPWWEILPYQSRMIQNPDRSHVTRMHDERCITRIGFVAIQLLDSNISVVA